MARTDLLRRMKDLGSIEITKPAEGVKFDAKMQNTRAYPTVIQWQAGKQFTVYPAAARPAGVAIKNTPRAQ